MTDWPCEVLAITAACPVQGFISERMQAGYDPEYLRQIFDFIVYTISCMEAPARRESTQKVCLSFLGHLHPHTSCTTPGCKVSQDTNSHVIVYCGTAQMVHREQLQLVWPVDLADRSH